MEAFVSRVPSTAFNLEANTRIVVSPYSYLTVLRTLECHSAILRPIRQGLSNSSHSQGSNKIPAAFDATAGASLKGRHAACIVAAAPAIRVQPVWRSGALRTAPRQRSQRRWMGRRLEAGRGALSRQAFEDLFPRRRWLRQSRYLRIPGSRTDQIRDPAARQPRVAGTDRPSPQAPCRTPAERSAAFIRELHLSGRKLDQAAPCRRQGRMASGRIVPARRLYRHQYGEARRKRRRLLQQARYVRTMDQGGQGGDQMDTGCHAALSPPTRSAFSFMRSPTISAISCARWRRPTRSRIGR